MQRQQGFTLLEIMVVIVILGVLASLVVPNLLGNKDNRSAKSGDGYQCIGRRTGHVLSGQQRIPNHRSGFGRAGEKPVLLQNHVITVKMVTSNVCHRILG